MAYSDAEVMEALIRLAINKYDFRLTSEQLGIPMMTLRRWNKNVPKKGVSELLERTIARLLMVIPERWDGNSWAIALGILIDKWQLIRGEPTDRTETIYKTLQQMNDDELDALYAEFQAAASRQAVDKPGEETAQD